MATSVFTSWADLYDQMLDQLASGDTSMGELRTRDTTLVFRSHQEFLNLLDYVERKKGQDSGAFVSRTYAKQGGRG